MFERKLYKQNAKKQLNENWKLASIVLAVMLVVSYITQYLSSIPAVMSKPVLSLVVSLFSIVLSAVSSIVIANFFYLVSKNQIVSVNDVLESFGLWLKGILATLWMVLWIMLWSLLFIIPGIVKSIAYSQMFFIIVENPQIGVMKALRLSKEMTKGHKGELFVMALSFLGWGILISLPVIIVVALPLSSTVLTIIATIITSILSIPLSAYVSAAFANVYHYLKQRAIETNVLKEEDFSGIIAIESQSDASIDNPTEN